LTTLPVIGLSSDSKLIGPHVYQCVGDKYVQAVAQGAGGLPLLIPSTPDSVQLNSLIERLDGLLLPGSYANVHPHHYSTEEPLKGGPLDPVRDLATLELIPRAIDAGLPVLGICRGFQEINVALGGSLHQRLHQAYEDHRENQDDSLEDQYGEAHDVVLTEGGLLHTLINSSSARVNSLHGQGIKDLAPGLKVEAIAPDGVIEAFCVESAGSFALGVQWHPEWRFAEHSLYLAIWQAFGEACRQRAHR
jgi:putative glutamine amidotransferase